MSGISFLVFSDDWGEHPSSCQHIFKHIVKEYPVVWVNTIGMRMPRLNKTDAAKAIKKVKKMFLATPHSGKGSVLHANLSVIQPFMLPFNKGPVRKLNQHSVIKTVRQELKRRRLNSPVLVTTVPNACDYVGQCGEGKVVYYCVDDFAEWPGLEHDLVQQMEQDLISKTDIFIATSQKLYHKLSRFGKPIHLLTHGVDLEHFSNEPQEEHHLLKAIPKPRVGYFGLFDERTDQDLLAKIVSKLPEVSFVITGRIEADISRLTTFPNVYFTGPLPYEELPAMVKGWDVCILPYVRNALTESISPLKLKEYMATGKAVISAPIPEARFMGELIYIAETSEEWEKLIHLCIKPKKNDSKRDDDRASFLMSESWEKKTQYFLERCL
ncbi:glycosyltransferase [Desulfovulcanus sp.]